MRLDITPCDLHLAHTWSIASNLASGGKSVQQTVHVELTDAQGRRGLGEASPSRLLGETRDTVLATLASVDTARLSFDDLPASFAYLASLGPAHPSARGALDIALLDGAARAANQRLCDFLGLTFTEGRHLTSFSIGLADEDEIRRKTAAAAALPVLKLKVGGPHDARTLAALRSVAPHKPVRLDANEAWPTKEEALRHIETLAADPHIEFIEQPMPAHTPAADLRWLRERSPLPLFADESFHGAHHAEACAETFHGVNMKLAKTAGVTGGLAALRAARAAGLRTMIGCMIESSLLLAAAAHLADLADHLDLDGSLLITNDPFVGPVLPDGRVSLAANPLNSGLGIARRAV